MGLKDRFVQKSAVFGTLSEAQRAEAARQGIDLSPGALMATAQHIDDQAKERATRTKAVTVGAGLAALALGLPGLTEGAAAGGTELAAGTALSSTPAVEAGASSTLFGGTAAASTPAMTTLAGAGGTALGGVAVPTATLGGAEALGLSAAAGATANAAETTVAPKAAAAKGGLFGTGISGTEAALGLSAASTLFAGKPPEQPAPEEVPTREEVAATMERSKTEDVATRAQDMSRRATAAGATRSDNEADLLGERPKAKRRSEARDALYGGRY
jgi:hypothetical protein